MIETMISELGHETNTPYALNYTSIFNQLHGSGADSASCISVLFHSPLPPFLVSLKFLVGTTQSQRMSECRKDGENLYNSYLLGYHHLLSVLFVWYWFLFSVIERNGMLHCKEFGIEYFFLERWSRFFIRTPPLPLPHIPP
jgi:hypothetical protein